MQEEQLKNVEDDGATEVAPSVERKHERSTIEFPYGDLDAAMDVAKTLYEHVGQSPCSPEQLAAFLQLAANSGGFRARIAPARVFGLIETERGKVMLTALGRQAVDPTQEKAARVNAFLSVPLYKKLFEMYKTTRLPPAAALEREMAILGVSTKQTDKARQVFERSADQAGFRAHGRDRLVMPVLSNQQDPPRQETPSLDTTDTPGGKAGTAGGGAPPPGDYHPFVVGLLKTLPPPDTEWKVGDRVKWLQTAASIFGLIYKGDGSIKVEDDTL